MSGQRYGITSVRIRDFRGIESLDLDFRDPSGQPNRVVVLAGPNGCGKTAVLEACLLALGKEELIRGPSRKLSPRIGQVDFSVDIQVVGRFSVVNLQADRVFTRPWVLQGEFIQSPALDVSYFSSQREAPLVGPVRVLLGQEGADGSLERNASRPEHNQLQRIKEEIVNARASELMSADPPSREQRSSRILDRIETVWRRFYPEEGFEIGPVSEDSRKGFDIFVSRQGERVSVDLLSSGQIHVFLLAGRLALEEPSPGIVFIDEPELHLDPQWHAVILRVLMEAQPECQFIVGTHSPEIYDSVMSYERHFLVPADDPRAKLWHVKGPQEGAA